MTNTEFEAHMNAQMGGYTQDELQAAFDKVKDAQDWKRPINAMVFPTDIEITKVAIRFYTATETTIASYWGGLANIKADGYRKGPAGDH